MLAISHIAIALLLAQGGLTEAGISAFNQGRYSVALAKLTEAAKDANDKQARLFLALAEAATGDREALAARARQIEDLIATGRYPSGPMVPAVIQAFAAFERRDFGAAIDALTPIAGDLERIGGSRAQLDLVAFTLVKAHVEAARAEEALSLPRTRRSGASSLPVAGVR